MVSWLRDAGKPQSSAQADSIYSPRGTMSGDVTVPRWGINKQCHEGTRASAGLDGDVIDGAVMRIRPCNLRQTPWLHGLCQSAVTTMERLRAVLKPNNSPPSSNNPLIPQHFSPLCSSCSCNSPKPSTFPYLSCLLPVEPGKSHFYFRLPFASCPRLPDRMLDLGCSC